LPDPTTRRIKVVTQRGKDVRAAIGDVQMRASIIGFALLATAALGCGHAEQQRQAREYERFLKDSLGTVATDAPAQARAGSPTDHVAN
jgi:hypothetical protein